MNKQYDEINLLVNDIIDGKAGKSDVSSRIDDLKRKYGEDIFPSIAFQKEKEPWNDGYFNKLKEMNITGACSEEFLLHMAEVKEGISVRKKRIIIGVIFIFIVLLFAIMIFVMKKASQKPKSTVMEIGIAAYSRESYYDFGICSRQLIL